MLLVTLLTIAAHAGDPCPIPIRVATHTPEWRSQRDDLAALTSQRRWLGVTYRARQGHIRVVAVSPGSPADTAGLRVNDIIETIGGEPVTSQADANAAFDNAPADGNIPIAVRRDGPTQVIDVQRGPADPLLLGLVERAAATECRDAALFQLTPEESSAVARGAFTAERGFRCDDAHANMGGSFEMGSVVLIRGGRRVMLTMPGWATVCATVAETDGPNLTPATLDSLLEQVSAAYVQHRHDNP